MCPKVDEKHCIDGTFGLDTQGRTNLLQGPGAKRELEAPIYYLPCPPEVVWL